MQANGPHLHAYWILNFRQALTETSVLSDVIQIVQHQKMYVAMDPVVLTTPSGSASPAYQYFAKKKALGLAAGILQRGTNSLSQSSTKKEKEFHKAISLLRQRWRLKRIGSGALIGDLSYYSGKKTKNLLAKFAKIWSQRVIVWELQYLFASQKAGMYA